ncbi:hypothetical protein SASPL_106203 [Salvia splendens]|uniref:Photosystem II reaction center Psb28 protein n=1 Tax=Salvia splendens TaxID=180675 RepID=A0A8X8YKF2_SALSN|nr:hypothetical protein SASPL_106203 [Salvia splendens]
MIDEEGVIQSVDVNAKFVNGKPAGIEAKYVMRTPREWDRFMRFMERAQPQEGVRAKHKILIWRDRSPLEYKWRNGGVLCQNGAVDEGEVPMELGGQVQMGQVVRYLGGGARCRSACRRVNEREE